MLAARWKAYSAASRPAMLCCTAAVAAQLIDR